MSNRLINSTWGGVLSTSRLLEDFDEKIEKTIEKIISKLDLPSKSDIKALNDRIDDLTKKIIDTNK
ncbi:MAG: phasin family protein [Desulfobacula sp.]|nr:phasin family protein [Desulfobacula sp.]